VCVCGGGGGGGGGGGDISELNEVSSCMGGQVSSKGLYICIFHVEVLHHFITPLHGYSIQFLNPSVDVCECFTS